MLVACSGRSGTSLFSLLLRELGFVVPGPEVPKDPSNPRGFAEPQWVVNYHQRLMQRLSVQMADGRPSAFAKIVDIQADQQVIGELNEFLRTHGSGAQHLVVKDPRLLWFLPLWMDATSAAGLRRGTVTMLRHPAEVLHSKVSWYGTGITDTHRVAGWINTMLGVERGTRGLARCFVKYDDLVGDWTQEIARMADAFDLPDLLMAPAQKQINAASIVDTRLKRSQSSWDGFDVPKPILELAETTWENLQRLVDSPHGGSGEMLALDQVRNEYDAMFAEAEALTVSVVYAAVEDERRMKNARIRQLEKQLKEATAKPAKTPKKAAAPRGDTPAPADGLPIHRKLVKKVPKSVRNLVPEEARKKTLGALDRAGDGGAN